MREDGVDIRGDTVGYHHLFEEAVSDLIKSGRRVYGTAFVLTFKLSQKVACLFDWTGNKLATNRANRRKFVSGLSRPR